jgi:23S rRNA maturation-related 3'-5' exoribonuclease YhaM
VNKFRAVPYDIMDVSAKQFDDDFYEFRCRYATHADKESRINHHRLPWELT